MKVLKKDLKTVAKNLKSLTQKTERMAKKLEGLNKAQTGKKPKAKAARKRVAKKRVVRKKAAKKRVAKKRVTKKIVAKKRVAKKRVAKKKVAKKAVRVTAIDTVMGIIKRSSKGVDATTLRKKTGFEGRKIRDLIYRLRKQGKIRAIGVSNWTPELMAEAMKHGDLASDQPKYSLLYREIEQDVLPFCHTNNVGCIAWSPLEQGILTGKVTMDRKFAQTDLRMQMKPWFLLHNRKRVLEALDTIRPVARAHDATLGQVAIAWVAAQPGVTAAIVGARNVQQVTENARAGALTLSADELAHIRGVFENLAPPPEEANA